MARRTRGVATQQGNRTDIDIRTSGGHAIPIVAPGKRLIIVLRHGGDPSTPKTYDASEIERVVRAKYLIP
jgi:hypothetical protein